ncbi:MAG TPA: c-type cytochrome [Burkholderiales bacterium]|nr:c-type cytochrome [Burkholderiales bacterium]
MSRRISVGALALAGAIAAAQAWAAPKLEGIGRAATPAEIRAWDIDVRPDFQGLPQGSGSVAKGQQVWEAKCASCHGVFGESVEVFTPIVGGTRKEDIQSGRASGLKGRESQRTTLMKLWSISTLWDYINRAMPWTDPKTLSVEEVYAVTAYILNLGEIVPANFTLSDRNIAEVQQLLPNRNGRTLAHGLWDIRGKPDVRNAACMKDCPVEGKTASSIPDYARNSHGNLAAQNRVVGPVRGADTVRPPLEAKAGEAAVQVRASARATLEQPAEGVADGLTLANQYACTACHGLERKIVGPGFQEIAGKYKSVAGAEGRLIEKIRSGGSGAWGEAAMPPQPGVSDQDLRRLAKWLLAGPK